MIIGKFERTIYFCKTQLKERPAGHHLVPKAWRRPEWSASYGGTPSIKLGMCSYGFSRGQLGSLCSDVSLSLLV